MIKVVISNGVGSEVQEVEVNKMTDISTAMFAIMKLFNEQMAVDKLIDQNRELCERVEELEERMDCVDTALRNYGMDDIDELTKAYDDACTALSDIYDIARDYA